MLGTDRVISGEVVVLTCAVIEGDQVRQAGSKGSGGIVKVVSTADRGEEDSVQ